MEQLILGVLYPVDINKAIDSPDGTILGYPDGYVEPQEMTLISELQDFLYGFKARWNVAAFAISDELYAAAHEAIMFLTIYPKLLNLRLKRCKTYEVHSFHIKCYLASHFRLDKYFPYLTLKQALYLYRNIRYIERNAGKKEMFSELMQHILTERSIPVSEYTVRLLSDLDQNYYPDLIARKKMLNVTANAVNIDNVDIEQLFLKEYPLKPGNEDYYKSNTISDILRFKTSISSVVHTKDLDSFMINRNDMESIEYQATLIVEWASMAANNMYNVIVNFKDPRTGTDITLFALDAFIYLCYIVLKSNNIDIEYVPQYTTLWYRRHPLPTLQELLSIVDSKTYPDLVRIATELLKQQPIKKPLTSIRTFNILASQIYEQRKLHAILCANTHGATLRGYVDNMCRRFYAFNTVNLTSSPITYEDWLFNKNLKPYSYSEEEAKIVIKRLYEAATGVTIDETKLLSNLQKNLIELFLELSSYTIQFIRELTDSTVLDVSNIDTRVDYVPGVINNEIYIPVSLEILETTSQLSSKHTLDLGLIVETENDIVFERKATLDTALTLLDEDDWAGSKYRTKNITTTVPLGISIVDTERTLL
jgi:hypothetical protein